VIRLRYVVLRHEGIDRPHFDLMFETSRGSMLATWRSSEWPVNERTRLEPLGEHRRDYLTYEGPISGDRGNVRRIHSGHHEIQQNDAQRLRVALENETILDLPRSIGGKFS
jgi:hypothetical protein